MRLLPACLLILLGVVVALPDLFAPYLQVGVNVITVGRVIGVLGVLVGLVVFFQRPKSS